MLQIETFSNTYFRKRKRGKWRETPWFKETAPIHDPGFKPEFQFSGKVGRQHTVQKASATRCCLFDFINVNEMQKTSQHQTGPHATRKELTATLRVPRLGMDQVPVVVDSANQGDVRQRRGRMVLGLWPCYASRHYGTVLSRTRFLTGQN